MYFGSVRFFKHLILAILVLLITVPLTVSVVLGVQNRALRRQLGMAQSGGESSGMRVSAAGMDTEGEKTPPAEEPMPEPTPESMPQGPDYQELYPDLYAMEWEQGTVDTEKTVYLTFDDGPTAQTAEVLALLERYDIKATFFAVRREHDEENVRRMLEVAEAGHALGIHSYSHDYKKIYASVEDYLDDFYRMYQFIFKVTGEYPQIFRFPGGSINGYNTGIYQDIIAEMERRGFVYFDWNVDAADTIANANLENVIKRALAGTGKRRALILMHDSGNPTSLAALPEIIQGYLDAGFTFSVLTPEVRQITL